MKITESTIINKYLKPLTFNNKKSLKLKDDIFFDKKKKIIFSIDTFIEDVHFIKNSNPKKYAKKIFRSSISDIFCKGSIPTTYFLSLSLNKTNHKWLKIFSNELKKDSKKYGLFLGGGDTTKSKKLSFTLAILGYVKTKPILRSNAKIGDDVYVTGNLGDAYLGLLTSQKKKNFGIYKNYFLKSFEQPDLPVKFSKYLYKFASSSIDISDGIINDLRSICSASKCGAKINFLKIPFSTYAKKLSIKKKINLIDIFSRGDDYQILFTAKKKFRPLIKNLSLKSQICVSRIGSINQGNSVKITIGDKNVNYSSGKIGFIHRF